MPRPTRITDDQIVAAARKVFLEHGYGATTAQIAKEAAVSEGSIFKRYPSKEALFIAAMRSHVLPDWVEVLRSAKPGRARETMVQVILDHIRFTEGLLPMLMMHWSARLRTSGNVTMDFADAPPKMAVGLLTAYLEAEAKAGFIHSKHLEITARMLLASAVQFTFFSMLGVDVPSQASRETFAEQTVDLLCSGLLMEGGP